MSSSGSGEGNGRKTAAAAGRARSGGTASPAVWVGSVLSAVALLAVTVLALGGSAHLSVADDAGQGGGASASAQEVSQTLTSRYCPVKIGVSDQAAYGDSQFAASPGDLASALQVAALGSVYDSSLNALDGSRLVALKHGKDSFTLGGRQTADKPLLLAATLLSASPGTGSLGTVASWASTGDVRGLTATPCTAADLSATFLVPSTQTGSVASLTLVNPSDKPTSVSLNLRGTDSDQPIVPSTGSTVTVEANSQRVVDLSAAAPGLRGLLVEVKSAVVPIFSTLTLSSADGLTPRGVDYLPQLPAAQTRSVLPGLSAGQAVTVRAYSPAATDLHLSWLGRTGQLGHKTVRLEAGRVALVDLGTVPQGAGALSVTAAEKVLVTATATAKAGSQDGQQDFAVIAPVPAVAHSALTVPDGLTASLVLANGSARSQTVNLVAFDGSGAKVGLKRLDLPANSAQALPLTDLGQSALTVSLDQAADSPVVWSAVLTAPSLAKAGVAQAAVLPPTSLMPQTLKVTATRTLLLGTR